MEALLAEFKPDIAHVHLPGDMELWDRYWTADEPRQKIGAIADVAAAFLDYPEGTN